MLYRQLFFKKKTLPSYFFSKFSQALKPTTPIKVRYSDPTYTNLLITLPHQTTKIFFINDKFDFHGIRDMILLESPLSKFSIIYPPSLPLKDESNVMKFLKSEGPSKVQIFIDEHEYVLSNDASFELNRYVGKVIEDSEKNKNNVLYWYKFCIENKIPNNNLGTLSYFMRVLNHYIEKEGLDKTLTQSEIENLFKKTLISFGCPVNKKIEDILEYSNEIDAEIYQLEKVKENIEEKSKKKIVFYQKMLLFLSLLQLFSFYYMIFHVEWLGWDIIEPITYTISQITLLCGIRFFFKYGKKRDFATMQEIFMNKIINRNRLIRDQYKAINEHLLERRLEKQKIQWKIDLLKNHRTYSQFLNNN